MRTLVACLVSSLAAFAQQGQEGGQRPAGSNSISPVSFDNNGWPVGFGRNPAPAPAGETRPAAPERRGGAVAKRPADDDRVIAAGTADEPLASGMHLDSPLHDVFRATRSPGALKQIGGVVAYWKLTVHGKDGAPIGERTYVHIADCAHPERDRLEYGDRVFVRDAGRVSAGRGGIPWEKLQGTAAAELALFGLHLRLPWCYGEGRSYAILRRDAAVRRGETLVKLTIERRPAAANEVFGPEATPRQRDRFELLYEPSTGTPRELLHRFASSGQQRRVLLEDWREFEGVRLPHRRIYVDESLRPTTTVQLMDVRRRRVGDRDFRLL
jgi:hypothetical protein